MLGEQGVCPPVSAVPGSRGQEDGQRGPQAGRWYKHDCQPVRRRDEAHTHTFVVDVCVTLGCSRLLFVMEGSIEKTSSLLNKENMSLKEVPEEGEG